MNLRSLLLLPGLIIGYIVAIWLGLASAGAFGDSAVAGPAVAFIVVVATAAVSARFRGWVRWLGGGAAAGATAAVASLIVLGFMFPSAASFTDKVGSRIADAHLAGLERTAEFQVAPDGYKLRKSWRQSGCSDSFDRREPATVRQYDAGTGTADDAVAFFGRAWQAAGYHHLDPLDHIPGYVYMVWRRDQDGWTATLSVFVNNEVVEVTGRDAGSHACK